MMAKISSSKTAKKRVKVQNLPAKEKKATGDDLKNLKGGVDGADFLTWQSR